MSLHNSRPPTNLATIAANRQRSNCGVAYLLSEANSHAYGELGILLLEVVSGPLSLKGPYGAVTCLLGL